MQTEHFTNTPAFKDVIIHGLIRDEQGRKMSKSLGNGIDPMDVIDQYGCDALRLFLTSTAAQGEDLNYSPTKLAANWNFLNKLWNGARYIFSLTADSYFDVDLALDDVKDFDDTDLYIFNQFNETVNEVTKNMDKYNFVVSTNALINFVWNEFLNTYLEFVKYYLQINASRHELKAKILLYLLKQVCIMLHSQCPFITEEIYQLFSLKKVSIMLESFPKPFKVPLATTTQYLTEILEVIRKVRLEQQLKKDQTLEIVIKPLKHDLSLRLDWDQIKTYLQSLKTVLVNENNAVTNKNPLSITTTNFEIIIYLNDVQDVQEQYNKLQIQHQKLLDEIKRSENILNNPTFLEKAPEKKVLEEKRKYENYQEQLKVVLRELDKLKDGNH